MKSQSPTDIFQAQPSPVPEEAPFDLSSSASTVPPAQKQTAVSWSSHCVNEESPCDCARDGVERCEKYFKDGEVLPVPELSGRSSRGPCPS